MSETAFKDRHGSVVILGVFVADAAYRATRQPKMGETILGSSFALGPGGKGSNQAVAAARCNANVSFITRLGRDAFAQMALDMYSAEGIDAHIDQISDSYTGSAYIFIDDNTGNNAIIVCPGAASTIDRSYVDSLRSVIETADVFVTQLEQPLDAASHALAIAHNAGVTTILNTAPAEALDDEVFGLCDFVTPNETEVEAYTGVKVVTVSDARDAADVLLEKGVGTALITLGEQGALFHNAEQSIHIPAVDAGDVVETTGAGDAFNGGFAAALAQKQNPVDAAHFACAVAGLSVTRAGTAPSMPNREEVDGLMSSTSS
jgi:ribokinase